MKSILIIIVCLVNIQYVLSQRLQIEVEGFPCEKGQILISYYYPSDDWLSEEIFDQQLAFPKDRLIDGKLIVTINDLKPGIYSIALCDDINSDGEMNYNILGIPKEGYGFSNNVKVSWRRPKFEECQFRLENDTTINICLQ